MGAVEKVIFAGGWEQVDRWEKVGVFGYSHQHPPTAKLRKIVLRLLGVSGSFEKECGIIYLVIFEYHLRILIRISGDFFGPQQMLMGCNL